MLRTHRLSDLSRKLVGERVVLCGWIHRRRDLGGLLLMDLRDHYGLVQLNFAQLLEDDKNTDMLAYCTREAVVRVWGEVILRPEEAVLSSMVTGEIELQVAKFEVLSGKSQGVLPFLFDAQADTKEELRLRYRYLDLRHQRLQKIFRQRSDAAARIRRFFEERDFLEVETPILYKSTPEGARDYLIPSRMHRNAMYALPQSPQTLKQLLMCAGFDRYYQITKSFRDEDLRADRQPEFTQVDMEASFVTEESIAHFALEFCQTFWQEPSLTMPQLSYRDAIRYFGSDKPDLRYGLPLLDVTSLFQGLAFPLTKSLLAQSQQASVVAIFVSDRVFSFSRKVADQVVSYVETLSADARVFHMKRVGHTLGGSLAKWFSEGEQTKLLDITKYGYEKIQLWLTCNNNKPQFDQEGDGFWFFVGTSSQAETTRLGDLLRRHLADISKVADPQGVALAWVNQFPLFEWDQTNNKLSSVHHPFTMPSLEDVQTILNLDPTTVTPESCSHFTSQCFDVVCNGHELSSGSIRIHRSDLQKKIFSLLGLSPEETEKKFGFFLEALSYGAPPHGGMAFGFDRMVMLLCGTQNLRDVVAFPKTTSGACLMSGAPQRIEGSELTDYGLAWLDQEVK
ncbi:MAG: aspartate--tRNA ligase [Proteobacteria bacterium]|nr:aspartate--tRNA ligase [Pseudomonadota bacterium]